MAESKAFDFYALSWVSFGSQHEIWSKQYNGKVRISLYVAYYTVFLMPCLPHACELSLSCGCQWNLPERNPLRLVPAKIINNKYDFQRKGFTNIARIITKI